MRPTLFFYPNKAKASKKNGKVPMYARIIFNGQKAEVRLDTQVAPSKIDLWNEATMRFEIRGFNVNSDLDRISYNFDSFRYTHASVLGRFTAKTIRDNIMGRNAQAEALVIAYIDNYYNTVVQPQSNLSTGTKKNYRKAIKHLKCFLAQKRKEDLAVSELSNTLALEFKDYLLAAKDTSGKVGMTEPSANGNIKKFRTIFDRAVDEGLLLKNPFKVVKLKNQSPFKEKLSIQHVKQLWEHNLEQYPAQQLYRDIFLFSAFTGLANKDAMSLKQTDLHRIVDGEVKLYLQRTKTNITTEVVLVEHAKRIIEKYRDLPATRVYNAVLPRRSNKETNLQLKMLADLVNIPIKLTSHIARHTYRQLLSEAGITDIGVIKRMMGHSSRGDIDAVYYSVTEMSLIEAKRKFEVFLSKHLPL
ncbi:MAG TPA: site-specific integrase [Flavisolibacter sp.]|nr:site-specific integrase [Flavisolibacter sp.]